MLLQAKQQQLVQDYEAKVATAADAERAIGRAMTTQVDSLRRQVASVEALQAENERLRKAVEVRECMGCMYLPLACQESACV